MRTSYSLFALAVVCFGPLNGHAQSTVQITDAGNNAVNGTVVNYYVTADATDHEFDLTSRNTAPFGQNVNVKRYELNVPSGTMNQFCWYECFLAAAAGTHPLWVSSHAVYLQTDSLYHGFAAHYNPENITAIASFRYVWFSTSNPSDTTYVDIVFHATPEGVEEQAASGTRFDVYPNPSASGPVTLNIDPAKPGERLEVDVYSVLGERVLSRSVANGQHVCTIPEGELGTGLWFATLRSNGRAIATKRVVIAGH